MTAREETRSSCQERINQALSFIQANLNEALSLENVAASACVSPFHFHRMFRAFTGESPWEFIQRLRLERAAQKLVQSRDDITVIALNVGYETPQAMARAFRKRFHCSPGEFRRKKLVPSPSPLLLPAHKEDAAMKPEIRTIEDFTVLSVRKTGPYAEASEQAWASVCKYAYSQKLMKKESRLIGMSCDDPTITDPSKLRYEACISIDGPAAAHGEVDVKTIPGGTYAVFLHRGPYERLYETYGPVFSQWLPESGEALRDVPCFEVYLNRDPRRTKPENLRTEIYVPLERHQEK